MSKYVFVTGGVVSSVGKGITVAATGALLRSRGVSVSVVKLDPYFNVDPGTMSPYQHGEVFVTHDGAETDLDLGHYERFIGVDLGAEANATSGGIYSRVFAKERAGEFHGSTIRVVPHVTDEIKQSFVKVSEESGADVVVVEIGGTVGDIEGRPFLEAIRQMRQEIGRDNVLYVHVTFLPYLAATRELKTKPTQHSVNELRSLGVQPDIIVCRSDYPIPDSIKGKVSLFCDVAWEAVIALPTVSNIYEVPLVLESEGLGQLVVNTLRIEAQDADLTRWQDLVDRIRSCRESVNIALVGKYVELKDTYLSVREALQHAVLFHNRDINLSWVHSEDLERGHAEELLRSAHGIVVPGGFGVRGIEGMVKAAAYARESRIPYLGLCLGLHVMVIEFARHVLGTPDVNSTEFDSDTAYPVIDFLPGQQTIAQKGGTMRLGAYPCRVVPGTKAARAYGCEIVYERHRHRYEFNNAFREALQEAGMIASGQSPSGDVVEIVELREHPWMVSCQFHPEFRSRPQCPHPLFRDFIGAAKETLVKGSQASLPIP